MEEFRGIDVIDLLALFDRVDIGEQGVVVAQNVLHRHVSKRFQRADAASFRIFDGMGIRAHGPRHLVGEGYILVEIATGVEEGNLARGMQLAAPGAAVIANRVLRMPAEGRGREMFGSRGA